MYLKVFMPSLLSNSLSEIHCLIRNICQHFFGLQKKSFGAKSGEYDGWRINSYYNSWFLTIETFDVCTGT